MANLKEVRSRISSVTSTRQITQAMKLVSAAKLRRAQDAITRMRPYAGKLKEILVNLSQSLEGDSAEGVYAQERDVKNVLIVAITSNRGLCGGFNSQVIRKVNSLITGKYSSQLAAKQISIMTIGKKATDIFKKREDIHHIAKHDELYDNLDFEHTAPIAEKIMHHFEDGSYDRVEIVYNHFKNPATQVVLAEQYLPVHVEEATKEQEKAAAADYIFEPNKQDIIKDLIPKSLKIQLYKAILDSHAGEHGARMTAMHQATDNATEMLKELRLTYNKARQAAITNEIIEIVSGAAALED